MQGVVPVVGSAGAALLAHMHGPHFEFYSLAAPECLLDFTEAFVAVMHCLFAGLCGAQIGAQDIAAIELGFFLQSVRVFAQSDRPLLAVNTILDVSAPTSSGRMIS